MLPKDLTRDIKTRLNYIKGQLEGLSKMFDEDKDPEEILNQFKAVDKGIQKAHYLLLDEVLRKDLALRIVEVANSCPGNCPDAEKIEYIRKEFPDVENDQIIKKIKEINLLKERMAQYNLGKDNQESD